MRATECVKYFVSMLLTSREGVIQIRVMLHLIGYGGGFRDWVVYGRWQGQRHGRQIWGEWMSNEMAVLIRVILWQQNRD